MVKKIILVLALCLISVNIAFSAEKTKLFTGENILACANYNDGPSSSDLSLIVQLESNGVFFVNEGSNVKYVIPKDDVKGFNEAKFDDSKWLDGVSGVGYADADDNTVIPDATISVYTRYHFTVKDPSAIKSLIFRADFDDQYIAWLNGIEISRSPGIGVNDLIPSWNIGEIRGGVIGNHEASDMPAGKPNKDRKYQLEVNVEFMPMAAIKQSEKVSTIWGKIKQMQQN